MEPVVGLKAVTSVEDCFYCPLRFIEVLDYRMGIALGGRGVDHDVVVFVHLFQEPVTVRTDIELQHILAHFERHITLLDVSH